MNCEKYRIALGGALRKKRAKLELSQEAFADLVGLHRTYVGSVERGERNVGIDNLIKLAKGLDISLSVLIRDAEKIYAGGRK